MNHTQRGARRHDEGELKAKFRESHDMMGRDGGREGYDKKQTEKIIFEDRIRAKKQVLENFNEEKKVALWKREDFNVFEVYRMYFDRESKGYIDISDFKYAFNEFGVDQKLIKSKYISIIFDYFRNPNLYNEENALKYSDFWKIFLPDNETYAAMAINRTPVYTNYDNPQNDENLRHHKELVGHTHLKLKQTLKDMFELLIHHLSKSKKGLSLDKMKKTNYKMLTEVDFNI